MINQLRQRFLIPRYEYETTDGVYATALMRITTLIGSVMGIMLASLLLQGLFSWSLNPRGLLIASGILLWMLFINHFTSRGHLFVMRIVFIIILIIMLTFILITSGIDYVGATLLAVPIVAAGMLASRKWILLASMLIVLILLVVGGVQIANTAQDSIIRLVVFLMAEIASVFGIGALIMLFTKYLRDVFERTLIYSKRLSDAVSVGQEISQLTDVDTLTDKSVDLIATTFDFNDVTLFMLAEDGLYLTLQAAAGEAGRDLLTRGMRVHSKDDDPIANSYRSGEPQMMLAHQHIIESSQSELVLPLGHSPCIGVLCFHSEESNIFADYMIGRTDANAFHDAINTVAGQLAASLQAATMIQQARQEVRENQRLYLETERALFDAERLNRQLTRGAWEEYLEQFGGMMGVTSRDGQIQNDVRWSDALQSAFTTRRPQIVEREDQPTVVSVPIVFREETLGALEIESGPGMAVQELVEMAQAVAGRLVQSMETVRLLNQVQKQAQSEQQLNATIGRIQEMNTIEDMLSTALASIGEAVGADKAAVYLRTRPDNEGGNGHV